MNGMQIWGEAIAMSLTSLWQRFIDFVPALVGALLTFLIGWAVASTVGKLAEKFAKTLRVDRAMEKVGFDGKILGGDSQMTASSFFGGLIRWFLILVFLMAASDILNLNQVTVFLDSVLTYIPNVIVAVVILATVFLIGNFVFNIVKGSTRAAGVMSATVLAKISKWAIIIFGIFAALIQLGVAVSLVNTIFVGIVAMLSIAGGLAFGLGGRDEAALILRKIREEISEKK